MSNILIVDDDTSIQILIKEALGDTHHIHTSETVAEAEAISNSNQIDLLIADLVIPEKNGIDMIMEFKKKQPGIKILAISGGGGITGRFDYLPVAQLVGAEDTLKRPFSMLELRNRVDKILDNYH